MILDHTPNLPNVRVSREASVAGRLLSCCVELPAKLQPACLPPRRLHAVVRLRNVSFLFSLLFLSSFPETHRRLLGNVRRLLFSFSYFLSAQKKYLACVVVKKISIRKGIFSPACIDKKKSVNKQRPACAIWNRATKGEQQERKPYTRRRKHARKQPFQE